MAESRETPVPPPEDARAEHEPLAGAFATATRADWERLVRAKDSDPERRLLTALEEGVEVDWLYTPENALAPDPGGLPGRAPFTRGARAGTPWAIRQRAATADPATANREILDELEGGASEILLAVDPQGVAGVAVGDVAALERTLDGVLLDLAPVALEGDPRGADLLLELLRRRGLPAGEVRASLRLDPLGSPTLETAATVARIPEVRAEFPRVSVLAVDTAPFAEAGAGGVLELALGLSAGVALLRAGEAAGIAATELAAATEFTLAVGPDQFLEIARLRAARRLWARVLESCGVSAEARRSPLYVRTSRRMYSSLDPWVNLLRATTAAFAAAVGGADGITVLPFDEPYGTGITTPGALGRRIARNTQLLLAEESSLHRVADPAGGSFYVESLTDQLARSAWREFQAIEASGGIEAILADGTLKARLAAATRERQDEIATRRRSLTGVNQFPLLGDDGLERPHPDSEDAVGTSPVPQTGDGEPALTLVRDAAGFEALRERAGRLDDARILLAATGPLAAHVSVVQWAKNFFEAGGVETVTQTEDSLEASGFAVAAVCVGKGSDPAAALAALREAGVETIYAVGAEIDGLTRMKDGVDMVAVLGGLLDRFEEAR